jgi:hypothetical protein
LGKTLRWAHLAALGAVLALAGCVTAENSLSQNDIAGMKLTGVTVTYAPTASIQWEDGVRAYAASKGSADAQVPSVARTPEGQAYVQNLLASRIKAGIERSMSGQLNGSRPVRLEVVVKRFDIPSAVQSIIVGGGRGMTADTNLIDARTGALIMANSSQGTYVPSGGGLLGTAIQAAVDNAAEQSPADKIVARYAEDYRNWLLRRG